MESLFNTSARVPLTVGTRGPYPLHEVPTCGDAWCVNGPPGPGVSTYFMCENCSKAAPDAIALGYAVKPKKLTPKDHIKINATAMCAFVRQDHKRQPRERDAELEAFIVTNLKLPDVVQKAHAKFGYDIDFIKNLVVASSSN